VGQFTIDLDDHQFRALNHSPLPEIGRPKVEVTAIVNRASLQDRDVHLIEKTAVIIRDLTEIQWRVVAAAKIVFLSVIAGKMPTEDVEMLAFRVFFDYRARTQSEAR